MQVGRPLHSGRLQAYNLPPFAFFPSSKLDAREEPDRRRLNRGRLSISRVCPRSIDVDVRSSVSAPSRTATGIGNDLERADPRHRTAIRAPKFARDVWPNIMGVITCQQGSAASGAIEIIDATGGTVVTGNLKNVQANRLNASLYSSIYSGSSTVQPPSLRLLPCIKF